MNLSLFRKYYFRELRDAYNKHPETLFPRQMAYLGNEVRRK